jgi:hypothetical protein
LGKVRGLGQSVQHSRSLRVIRLGKETGMQRQVAEAQRQGSLERPLEPLQPLGAPGRIAESSCDFDRLGSGVILAGKTQHGPRHDDSRGSRCLGQSVSLVPACVVRVAASDLHHVDTQPIEQPPEFGNTPDLKAPATNAQAQGRKDWSRGRGWLRHVVFPGNRARSGSASPRRLAQLARL